jgi:tellurite resistance protein TerC
MRAGGHHPRPGHGRALRVLRRILITDLIFAVDSIPAILAVTTDTFVVYTSNVFALLGMRALYFVVVSGTAS